MLYCKPGLLVLLGQAKGPREAGWTHALDAMEPFQARMRRRKEARRARLTADMWDAGKEEKERKRSGRRSKPPAPTHPPCVRCGGI